MVTSNTGMSFSEGVASRGFVRREEEIEPAMVTGRTRLAWGAVIAGSLTSVSLLILASTFAYAIRLPAYLGGEYGIGTAIYGIVSSMIAFFFGGMMVPYLSPRSETHSGVGHGVMAWVVTLPLMLGLAGFAASTFSAYLGAPFIRMTMGTNGELVVSAGAAWGGFLAMLLGLIAAGIGGMVGFVGCRKVKA